MTRRYSTLNNIYDWNEIFFFISPYFVLKLKIQI